VQSFANVPLRSEEPPSNRPKRFWQIFVHSLAAKTLAATLVPVLVCAINMASGALETRAHYETTQTEQRNFRLPEGSIVQLNLSTSIDVRIKPFRREVRLNNGEARFTVTHDSFRPFFVNTTSLSVRVTGTVFNVRTHAGSSEVCVLQGRVEVTAAGSSLPLPAGSCVTQEEGNDLAPLTGVSAQPLLARSHKWPELWMSLDNVLLGELLERLNKYYARPVYITDRELALQPLSGLINVHDRAALLRTLELHVIRSDEDSDGIVWLSLDRQDARRPEELLTAPLRKRN
jgi:transmembrane sensor